MSADVLLWMIVAGFGMIWLGFWWMRHGPDTVRPPDGKGK